MSLMAAYLLGIATAFMVSAAVAFVVGRALRWASPPDPTDQAGA